MEEVVYLISAGGHGSVVADALLAGGRHIGGVFDDAVSIGDNAFGVPVLGGVADAARFINSGLFVIAIGDNHIREHVAGRFPQMRYACAVHPRACVSPRTSIGDGSVIFAGAVINSGASVGRHCIINTSSVVEHDCEIGDFTHISPGAVMGGNVRIGRLSHIGLGASLRNGISIPSETVIGMGAAVTAPIDEKGIYAGVPAKRLR